MNRACYRTWKVKVCFTVRRAENDVFGFCSKNVRFFVFNYKLVVANQNVNVFLGSKKSPCHIFSHETLS
jgi:hypothetical protein